MRILTEGGEEAVAECSYLVKFQADNYGNLPNKTEAKALINAALAGQPHFESTCVSVEEVYENDPPHEGQQGLFH